MQIMYISSERRVEKIKFINFISLSIIYFTGKSGIQLILWNFTKICTIKYKRKLKYPAYKKPLKMLKEKILYRLRF